MDSLKEIYRSNAVARAFLDHAARRSYDQQETKVDRALINMTEDGHQFDRKDIVDLFKRFETLGYGNFVIGRRGQPSRFIWNISLISAGKAATGEASSVVDINEEETVPEILLHTYHLRSDMQIDLSLPIDLTLREAERLAMFVRSLPLEAEQ